MNAKIISSIFTFMNRIVLLSALLLFAVSCGPNKGPKILVLYYSQGGTTKTVAEALQGSLEADIEAIVPVKPYDGDFGATIERCRQEMEAGEFPEIQPLTSDVRSYDLIFLGFPIWFGTYARPVETLLNTLDFSGKKIVPFCTFGSGGLDSSSKAIREKLPEAEVLPGYGVRTARIAAAPAEVDRFLKRGGFMEGECEPLEDFPAAHPVSEEEAALFDAAVDGYPMLHAKAEEVTIRTVPEGKEYLFTARDLPREMPGVEAKEEAPRFIKVYVLSEQGKAPVFTQVIR